MKNLLKERKNLYILISLIIVLILFIIGFIFYFLSLDVQDEKINKTPDNAETIEKIPDEEENTIEQYEVGTEICIKEECFYVISSTDETLTMLAKYNLHVGNEISEYYPGEFGYIKKPLENPTGMQSELALGSSDNESHFIGTTEFSNHEQKGKNFSSYNGSVVEIYVNNYKSLLEENFDIRIEEARLISYEELTNPKTFACKDMNKCSNNYPWIYSTSYWTGSSDNSNNIWYVDRNNFFFYCDWDYGSFFGVRPVITITKSYIEQKSGVVE